MTFPKLNVFASLVTVLGAFSVFAYVYSYELWLALQVVQSEGGLEEALEPSNRVSIIGHIEPRTISGIYPYLDGASIRNAVLPQPDGCFVLAVPGAMATLGVLAHGFKPVSDDVQAGYYVAQLTIVETSSRRDSNVGLRKISFLEWLRRMRACQGAA
jgi:hypothetical protein